MKTETGPQASRLPTSSEELIFPSASYNLSTVLNNLRQSSLSIHNRLRSILEDAEFAQHVSSQLQFPLVANERCGSWYIPPPCKIGSAYFKSTDGHVGQWKFSLRRLNVHLLDIIGQYGGCIIVDSTRKGKSMPDALSRTVPIWCAVINGLLFRTKEIFLPRQVVGESEEEQIQDRLEGWLKDAETLDMDLRSLRSKLTKPLRPFWITPGSLDQRMPTDESDFHPVVCCTVSRRLPSLEASDAGYVQGAADDSESWALGITPQMLWEHAGKLLDTPEEELPDLVRELSVASVNWGQKVTQVQPTKNIFIGQLGKADGGSFDGIVVCSTKSKSKSGNISISDAVKSSQKFELDCGEGKLGSRALRSQLPLVNQFIERLSFQKKEPMLLFACSTGKDLSAGAALVALCLFFDDHGVFRPDLSHKNDVPIDKELIRRRLVWITTSDPNINPSRATLQAVNSFLMPSLDIMPESNICNPLETCPTSFTQYSRSPSERPAPVEPPISLS